ncbi:LPXTG cell wall anchor domain-containing protein [Micromonospora sp. PLK6-60]|uniref:LPXTG cell wall anchor domain-containing protein n=1 Tax=Micromonospora sp. PLK6-60 TaxID=2873383 RepID=UPI001CA621E3|nr:LPXTG cell wall anchor domain-containing protein [Micromonospora sp. PLK6-60]MBY8872867.1 LPXTG cell wall anchor domain-containing protein [Micromonospora sp. PLK6-60]
MPAHAATKLVRSLVALCLAALVGAAVPTPAQADFPPHLRAWTLSVHLGEGGAPGKQMWLTWYGAYAKSGTITLDLGEAAALAELSVAPDALNGPDHECVQPSAAVLTCEVGELDGEHHRMPIRFTPKASARFGDAATFTVSARPAGVTRVERTTVDLAIKDGPDLVLLDPEPFTFPNYPIVPAPAGTTRHQPVRLTNASDKPSRGVTMWFHAPVGVFPGSHSNCRYGEPYPWYRVVACDFDVPIEPNRTYEVVGGLDVRLAPDAVGDFLTWTEVLPLGESMPEWSQLELVPGSGPELAMRAIHAQAADFTEIDFMDNFGAVRYRVRNRYDVIAVGATLSGAVGTLVDVRAGVRISGKAALTGANSAGRDLTAEIRFPDWVRVVTPDPTCADYSNTHYACPIMAEKFGPDEERLFGFRVEITKAGGAPGEVSLRLNERLAEHPQDTRNDRAEIGYAAASPSPSPSVTVGPTASPSGPAPGPSTGGPVDVTPSPTEPGGLGGGLPRTGMSSAVIWSGAALVLAGAVLLLVTRRRGRTTEATDQG